MLEVQSLPADLPWTIPAYLMIDGVRATRLVQHLHDWGNPAYCLYQHTRWHELMDISPCLISVPDAHDPLLLHVLDNGVHEWGYLLFSHATVQVLCDHWRNLLMIEDPSGVQLMPRIADPAVMHEMFRLAEHDRSARWFGPVEYACLPDALQGTWLRHQRPDGVDVPRGECLRFTDREFTALGEVEGRRSLWVLSAHLQHYFPDYPSSCSARERLQSIRKMAQQAYELGFTSEQELTLYANVQAYLAGQDMQDHSDIVDLLTNVSSGSPLSRVMRAAELAERRALHKDGGSP